MENERSLQTEMFTVFQKRPLKWLFSKNSQGNCGWGQNISKKSIFLTLTGGLILPTLLPDSFFSKKKRCLGYRISWLFLIHLEISINNKKISQLFFGDIECVGAINPLQHTYSKDPNPHNHGYRVFFKHHPYIESTTTYEQVSRNQN